MSAPGGRRVRGVLFDMDGVLLDTERLSMTLLPDVIRQLGYESPAGLLDRIRGTNSPARGYTGRFSGMIFPETN